MQSAQEQKHAKRKSTSPAKPQTPRKNKKTTRLTSTSKAMSSMETDSKQSLLSLFLTTPASDHLPRGTTGDVMIHKEGPVMTVQSDESLPRVFRKLAVEGFLSAPVLDGRQYMGFIDMIDLVKKTMGLFWGDTVEEWVNFWDKEERFMSTTVSDVMATPNPWDRDPFPPLAPDFSSFYALEVLARTGAHRLAVVDPTTQRVTGILTHSMMISWLRQNLDKCQDLLSLKVSDIKDDLKRTVITIQNNEKAINAFNKMVAQDVSGLAVVDSKGVLTGAISVRDLRGVGTSGEFFYRLFHTIKDFKKEAREDFPKQAPKTHYSRKMVPVKGLYVSPDQTFQDVLNLMNDGNIHRVFVCSAASIKNGKPVPTHVISQRDVLMQVLNYFVEEAASV